METKEILKQSVIKTLLYYDIFNYPLKASEVYRFLPTNSVAHQNVEDMLEQLAHQNLVYRFDNFYTLQNSKDNVIRRIKGNDFAKRAMELACKRAKLISRFPFVRAVFASGSLSKGYMDKNSDLDFFIITSPGRLWIARTLIVTFKRLFLFNSHKYFCCNYFIDSDHLEIEEKNLFTATELATLLPLYGGNFHEQMMTRNTWLLNFFPNLDIGSGGKDMSSFWLKSLLENILENKAWNSIEKYFMRITLKRWRRLYEKKYQAKDFDIAFKSNEHVSKNHPNHYQQKVMRCYFEKLRSFSREHDIHLDLA